MTEETMFKLIKSYDDDDFLLGLNMLVKNYPTLEEITKFFSSRFKEFSKTAADWDNYLKSYIPLSKRRENIIYDCKEYFLDTGEIGIFVTFKKPPGYKTVQL